MLPNLMVIPYPALTRGKIFGHKIAGITGLTYKALRHSPPSLPLAPLACVASPLALSRSAHPSDSEITHPPLHV